MVEGLYPSTAMVAMKSASVSGCAGRGVRPASSHHPVKAAQSRLYALRVFAAEADAANALAASEIGTGETWELGATPLPTLGLPWLYLPITPHHRNIESRVVEAVLVGSCPA